MARYLSDNRQPPIALPTKGKRIKSTVDAPSKPYLQMLPQWELINDLLGGTMAMRNAGKKWLPAEARENSLSYEARLHRSYLYGAYKDTIQKLSAKPFSKPVTVTDVNDTIDSLRTDADLKGSDLTQFVRAIFEDGLKYGMGHVLVDYPTNGQSLTLYDEKVTGTKPYFCRISPMDLIAWQTARLEDGSDVLTQIRFKERGTEYDENGFEETEVEYIRVIDTQAWQLWRKNNNDEEYVLHDEGTHTFGAVPLATFYTMRKDFMVSNPPLEDLAWLNLAHWQSLSDQRNILRFARVGLLFASGFSEEEIETGINIGPSSLISSNNPDANLSYVEHSGRAIGAGEDDLKRLEERMEVLGLQPLVQNTGNVTATARAMDEARTHSNIQAWIRGLENMMQSAYEMAGHWIGQEIGDDFALDIFNDFGVSMSATEDVKSLMDMYSNGTISHETFIKEVKRRGILSDEVDASLEMELIGEAESQAMNELSLSNQEEEDE
tara:strand:+ start:4473 stop:5951 length:1479 start_codon:yes stop_codon:yes gene_type:complete